MVCDRQVTPRRIFLHSSKANICKWTCASEQARRVKTVKVRVGKQKPCTDQTVGCLWGATPQKVIAIDWVTCRSNSRSWLNVQSGYRKSYSIAVYGERYSCDQADWKGKPGKHGQGTTWFVPWEIHLAQTALHPAWWRGQRMKRLTLYSCTIYIILETPLGGSLSGTHHLTTERRILVDSVVKLGPTYYIHISA